MNGFTKKSIGTLTLGEKLGKLRSDRRISLTEVSRVTKIQVKYLEYLEKGVYDKLPADVYVKGFLRNYSEFLGVDEKILVKLYEKERGIENNLKKGKKTKKEILPSGREKISITSLVITPGILAVGAIILLVCGGFFYLYKELGSFASMPRLVIIHPEKNHFTADNSVEISGITDQDAKIFINEQPVIVNDGGKFNENLTVQSGTNTVTIKAVNRFNKEAVEILTVQSDHKEAEEKVSFSDNAQDNFETQKNNLEKIEIEVRVDPGPVWVSIKADENLVFSGTMLSGSVQKVQAENKIAVSSGKGKATFVKFNGQDMGVLGENSGTVREREFFRDMKR
jgi:cytoskeletal protein RodZ